MAISSLGKLPKHSEIVHALTPLADKYFELGTQLELDYKQLKAIENDHKGNQSRCLIETIVLWQQNNTTGECSWSALAEAITRIGGHDKLVSELKKRGRADSKSQTPHYPPETKRATNVGYLSVSDSTQSRPQRCDSRPSESEDESGYSSRSDSVQSGDSSGSEAECFELAPGCGCIGEKPCSLYTLCVDGCPNPTKKRVPVLRKKLKAATTTSQNEFPSKEDYHSDFEDYEKRTNEIHESFGTFLCETCDHFETKKVDLQKLSLYVQGAYPVMKPRMEELSKATNFKCFFRIIVDQACSWFDYRIIKDMILRFCTSAKKCLDEYEACFKKYAEQRLPKGMKHIEIGGGARKGGKQLVIKIDREWEEVTFSDLDKLRGTFASILNIRRSDLYLADIREGCIMMTFMITEELAGRLKSSLSSSQTKSFRSEGVISLKCGKMRWRAAINTREHDQSKTKSKRVQRVFEQRIGTLILLLCSFAALFVFIYLTRDDHIIVVCSRQQCLQIRIEDIILQYESDDEFEESTACNHLYMTSRRKWPLALYPPVPSPNVYNLSHGDQPTPFNPGAYYYIVYLCGKGNQTLQIYHCNGYARGFKNIWNLKSHLHLYPWRLYHKQDSKCCFMTIARYSKKNDIKLAMIVNLERNCYHIQDTKSSCFGCCYEISRSLWIGCCFETVLPQSLWFGYETTLILSCRTMRPLDGGFAKMMQLKN